MDKFQGKYRRESLRLQKWDYRWAASYFITLNTNDRRRFFGEIKDGKMILSPAGIIANSLWYEIPNHSKDIELGEFVVMPDHIHGIITIKKSPSLVGSSLVDQSPLLVGPSPLLVGPSPLLVGPRHALGRLKIKPLLGPDRFQNIGKNSLSSIVGSYKSAVTKHANRSKIPFKWQPLFYEHIIRDERAYWRISDYIRRNPEKWKK